MCLHGMLGERLDEEGQAWRAERKPSVSSPETYLGFGICTFAVS